MNNKSPTLAMGFLALSLALLPSLHGSKTGVPSNQSQSIRLHELDRRQAGDMAKAWADLLTQRTEDHYIKATLMNSVAPAGHELVRLKAHGTLLNLTFQDLEDDDERRAVMVRARDVVRLEVLKRPW